MLLATNAYHHWTLLLCLAGLQTYYQRAFAAAAAATIAAAAVVTAAAATIAVAASTRTAAPAVATAAAEAGTTVAVTLEDLLVGALEVGQSPHTL